MTRKNYGEGRRRLFGSLRDPYDKARDDSLDFPDDPRSEPDLEEVKERAYACSVDESAGERERRYGDG